VPKYYKAIQSFGWLYFRRAYIDVFFAALRTPILRNPNLETGTRNRGGSCKELSFVRHARSLKENRRNVLNVTSGIYRGPFKEILMTTITG